MIVEDKIFLDGSKMSPIYKDNSAKTQKCAQNAPN